MILQRASVLLLMLYTLNGTAQTDSLRKLPPVHWTRTRFLDVKHLAIDLRFDWKKKQAYGSTTITFAPLHPTDQIKLDAGMLTIKAIQLSDKTPLQFNYDEKLNDNGLAIALDRLYQAGEEITIRIDYHTNLINTIDPSNLSGNNGKGLRFSEPFSNDILRPREIWSIGEPESNRYWFPGYDSPNDFRTTEFRGTVDKDLMVLSNGILTETTLNADGTRTFHWKAPTPYPNHLTSFVVGQYADVRQEYQGIALHSYGYPSETQAVSATVNRLPDMIRFYSGLTGVKYPDASYSQVTVQDLPWGFGNNGLSTQSENMVDDEGTHADYLYLWDGLEAETLAHQWFGNRITCIDWSHSWLNKGFSHYFDELYSEYKNGHEEFLISGISGDLTAYLADWNAGYRRPVVTKYYDDAAVITGDNYSYGRAALVLNMLRQHLGKDQWQKAIHNYLTANANRPVSTEDFRKAVEEMSGEALDWFFDQWIYKIGHPVFHVSKKFDDVKKQLTLLVRQTQIKDRTEPYPQNDRFQGKVGIEINGKVETVWLEARDTNTFIFSSEREPKLVHFDFENSWIKELTFDKSLDELLYQLEYDKDILGKRWALFQLVAKAKSENTSANEKERIHGGLRNTALSTTYWRLKLNAITQLQILLVAAAGPKTLVLDDATTKMLLTIINKEKAWTRSGAINFLGMTRDPKYADLYLHYLSDPSDRVIASAASALGKSKSKKSYNALARLVAKPSWKNQSLMSALNGLKELGDPRGADIAYNALADSSLRRWRLPNGSVWDYRVFAVQTLAVLGGQEKAYPLLARRFKKSMEEDDLSGIFNNTLLIATLGDPRGREIFDALRAKYRDNETFLQAVDQYETQFKDTLKK